MRHASTEPAPPMSACQSQKAHPNSGATRRWTRATSAVRPQMARRSAPTFFTRSVGPTSTHAALGRCAIRRRTARRSPAYRPSRRTSPGFIGPVRQHDHVGSQGRMDCWKRVRSHRAMCACRLRMPMASTMTPGPDVRQRPRGCEPPSPRGWTIRRWGPSGTSTRWCSRRGAAVSVAMARGGASSTVTRRVPPPGCPTVNTW